MRETFHVPLSNETDADALLLLIDMNAHAMRQRLHVRFLHSTHRKENAL